MAVYGIVIANQVQQIFTTAPVVHEGIEVVDLSAYSGAAAGWWRQSNGTFAVTAPVSAFTEDLRQEVLRDIDRGAEVARTAWFTPGSSQSFVYQQKQIEAAKVVTDSAVTGSTTTSVNYPYLSASVGAEINPNTGVVYTGILQVAAQVAYNVTQQTTAFAAIEKLRLIGKAAVKAATTYAQALAASVINWPTPPS